VGVLFLLRAVAPALCGGAFEAGPLLADQPDNVATCGISFPTSYTNTCESRGICGEWGARCGFGARCAQSVCRPTAPL